MRRERRRKSEFIHLAVVGPVFITPPFGGNGYKLQALAVARQPQLSAVPVLYAKARPSPVSAARWYPFAMVALSMALLPWHPSGLSLLCVRCVAACPVQGVQGRGGYHRASAGGLCGGRRRGAVVG